MPELEVWVPKPSSGLRAEGGRAVSGSSVRLVLGQLGAEDPSLRCQTAREETESWRPGEVSPQHDSAAAVGAALSLSCSPVNRFLLELL